MKVLVTGGAGFIGSAVCRLFVGELNATVLNVDNLTYAANLGSLRTIEDDPRYAFRRADICDRQTMTELFRDFDPDAVLHLAAESHVDRSIDGPAQFIKTNVEGTYVLLEAALAHWRRLPPQRAARFRFRKVGVGAEQPMRPTPICRQLPLFRHCRRGGATAGSGGQRGHRGVAGKLVGQPQRAGDAREAEMPASPVAESQRALMTAVRVVSKHIVRAARVAPSCTECTRPPTGRSRSGSRTTLGSSWATAICPIRTE
jgi:NAD(P)-dependent dehydrogenase (short-subunit alcohol dehydrogenase family)